MIGRRLLRRVLILSIVITSLSTNAGVALAKASAAGLQTAVETRSSSADGPSGYVTAWRLNVRAGPGPSFAVLTKVSYREVLALTGRTYDFSWLQIRRDDGQQGWVSRRYMMVSDAHLSAVPVVDGTVPPSTEITGYVTAYGLNVRSGPGIGHPVISVLYQGQTVTLVGRNYSTEWLQLNLPDGSHGWVSARYIGSSFMLEALPITGGAVPNPAPGATATVTAIKLNVRSGPGVAYGIMAWVYKDQQIQLVGRNNARTWLRVAVGHGLEGWVSAAFLTTDYPIADLPVVE